MRDDREDYFQEARRVMVETQIRARGVTDPRVLAAMGKVPRHLFIPTHLWDQAYSDYPLPIGEDQTISQPYIVALMTEALELAGPEKVLELGTGSGYQAAVLAELAREVYTIERLADLTEKAQQVITALGYTNVDLRVGDGTLGWPEAAPFDAILVTRRLPPGPRPPGGTAGHGGAPGDPGGGPLQPDPDPGAAHAGGLKKRLPGGLPVRQAHRQARLASGNQGRGGVLSGEGKSPIPRYPA